jgi:hypothetical protein
MLIKAGRLEIELIPNPKNWGWKRGRTEVHDGRAGWYLTVGPLRLEWWPLNEGENR